jgi:hypothetical protein
MWNGQISTGIVKAVKDQLSASFKDGDVTLKPSERDQPLKIVRPLKLAAVKS